MWDVAEDCGNPSTNGVKGFFFNSKTDEQTVDAGSSQILEGKGAAQEGNRSLFPPLKFELHSLPP